MTRVTRITPVLAVLLTGCGFGTWDETDVLFDKFKVVPARESLQMKLPGAEQVESQLGAAGFGLNAACGGEGAETLTCGARQIVRLLNSGTSDILKLVETITAKDPSRRERGRRIWGPHFDSVKQRTFRFEMSLEGSADAQKFVYCLHVAAGNRTGPWADAGVECGKDTGRFVEVIRGSFTPDADAPEREGGVRHNGEGNVTLDFNKSFLNGVSTDDTRGVLSIDYRFDEATSIVLTIGQGVDERTGRPTNGEYRYTMAADRAGFMSLTLFKELRDCALCFDEGTLERFNLTAKWNAVRASLVEARASGGDIPNGTVYYGYECVDENNTFVARRYDWEPAATEGNPALCAFPPETP